jgi:hypothetical protein
MNRSLTSKRGSNPSSLAKTTSLRIMYRDLKRLAGLTNSKRLSSIRLRKLEELILFIYTKTVS